MEYQGLGKIRVLIVDDHPLAREGLRTMLNTASDIEVVAEACDGVEAVEKADEHQPEIVLMDVRMPNMDGMEATRRIKTRLPSVSVIVLTAFDSEAYIVDAIRSGAVGYLPKESSKDLLIHSIRAVNSGGMLIKSSLFREAVLSWSDTGDAQVKEKSAANVMLKELTPREREVLWHMIDGRTNGEIGKVLFIGEDTAKKHVQAILHKLGVSDRTQAAVKAVRLGLSDLLPGPKHS